MTAMHERLERTRAKMSKMGVDAIVVRSTDRYLNEYVPTDESARVWVSGFTGSTGDAIITMDDAYLAVDGRYWIQAEQETDSKAWTIIKVRMGGGIGAAISGQLKTLADERPSRKLRIGFEPDRVTPAQLELSQKQVEDGPVWKPLFPSPVEAARGADRPTAVEGQIRAVDERRVGMTVEAKLEQLAPTLGELGVDAILVQRLDEIAYLSNLRGDELENQSTFKAIALADAENLFIGINPSRVAAGVRKERQSVLFVPESEFWTLMGAKKKRVRVGYDPSGNTEQCRLLIKKTGATPVPVATPIGPMKAKKNKSEMKAMMQAFRRADAVVAEAISWACKRVTKGDKLTEAEFAEKVESLFWEAGATGLSFKVISAAGKNGAIIHYSNPSKRRVLKRGELMLLDTGAYFAEGYATDLTRTFLLDGPRGKANDKQKRYYTLVLKAAMAGMRAIVPEGASGASLDAIVRAPLWAEGLDYNHGTGHGVGINVHESPPRIAPMGATALEVGQVFSIEPGLYIPSFGGIRIENLCTVEPAKKKKGFLQVKPLTFSPLDKRLIDKSLLTADEKSWLADYARQHVS